MSPMRDAATRGPALLFQRLLHPEVLDQTVSENGVHLQNIPVGPESRMAQQVSRVLMGEEVLARRQRSVINLGQLRMGRVIEGIERLLIPAEAERRHRLPPGNGGRKIETPVRVHRQPIALADEIQHAFDAAQILRKVGPADLHLHDPVAHVEIPLHLRLQRIEVFPGVIIAARRIDEYPFIRRTAAIPVRKKTVKRFALDLRSCVPDGHVDDPDGHRPFAVPPRLLVRHHDIPDAKGVQVAPFRADQFFGVGRHDPGDEPLAEQRALGITAVRIEAVAHHGLPVPDHVRGQDQHRNGHLAEVDVGVADLRGDGYGFFPDVYDAHGNPPDFGLLKIRGVFIRIPRISVTRSYRRFRT